MYSKALCALADQVSGEDADDYKRTLRAQLKALIEKEKDPLGPTEWVVCYIKPAASDPLSKGPKKVRNRMLTSIVYQPCMLPAGLVFHVWYHTTTAYIQTHDS